jgi:hypothetical protein
VKGIDQKPAISAACIPHDSRSVMDRPNLAPGHDLEINTHAELIGQITQTREVRNQAAAIGIIATDAETFGPQRSGSLKRLSEGGRNKVFSNWHELDVIDVDAFPIEAAAHLSGNVTSGWQLVEGCTWKRWVQAKPNGLIPDCRRKRDEIERRHVDAGKVCKAQWWRRTWLHSGTPVQCQSLGRDFAG